MLPPFSTLVFVAWQGARIRGNARNNENVPRITWLYEKLPDISDISGPFMLQKDKIIEKSSPFALRKTRPVFFLG